MITARRFTSTKILDFCTISFIASMPMKMRDRRCQGQRPTSSSSCVAVTRNYRTISERQNEYSSPRRHDSDSPVSKCRSLGTMSIMCNKVLCDCKANGQLWTVTFSWWMLNSTKLRAQGYLRKLIWPRHHTDSKANKYIVSPLIHLRWMGLIHLHWLV